MRKPFEAGAIAVLVLFGALTVSGSIIRDPNDLPVLLTNIAVDLDDLTLPVGVPITLQIIGTFEDGTEQPLNDSPFLLMTPTPEDLVNILPGGQIVGVSPGDVLLRVSFARPQPNGTPEVFLNLEIRLPEDTDGDGLPDDYESANGLNPGLGLDGASDFDGDGLTAQEEFALGLDPRNPDTDGDSLPDGLEVLEGTDPHVPEPSTAEPASPLDETCVVSTLNRTALVQPGGFWVIPNVPANLGRVRVRAVCSGEAGIRYGQSGFVNVPADGVLSVPEIDFDQAELPPRKLSLLANSEVLSSPGETLQLSCLGTMPDGSTVDLTGAEAGTTYRTSMAGIASIGDGGLVTAQSSGAVLISAFNDGVSAFLRLRVILSGDADGDGLPDDFEVANGLDPNDPADALVDLDEDGLSTLEEFQLGLDPFDGDSDDDGLLDGDEVNFQGTDPLLFDTDGDGLSDGLEIQTGSDPLDPASFNLASALTSLEVTPSSFTLIFNTVLGEASRQLSVIGTLIDGTTLDLTSPFYGTTYSSSDLTIANFGVDPGRVFAGVDGLALVTASVGGFSVDSTVTVETFSPVALSYLPFAGGANSIEVDGDFAFILGNFRLSVVDVSDLDAPFLVSEALLPGIGSGFGSYGRDLVQEAGFAYSALGSGGIRVVDTGLPHTPAQVAAFAEGTTTLSLALKGTILFAGGVGRLHVYDVSDPTAPVELGQTSFSGQLDDLELMENFLVGAASSSGVLIFDISDPSSPALVGQAHTRAGWSRAAGVAVDGTTIFVADGARRTLGGLRMLDASDPATPVLVGATGNSFGLTAVELDGTLALTSDYFFVNAAPIFRATDGNPIFQSLVDFSGPPSFRADDGVDLALQGGAVFLLAGPGLHIGRYRIPSDTEGIAPQVAIASPLPEDVVPGRTFLTVEADAEDDQAVRSVEFFVDGVLLRRDLARPYSASFLVPGDATALSLTAVATDDGGNTATSEVVPVAVAPNTEPTIALLAPQDGAQATRLTTIPVVALATDDVAVERVEFSVDGSLRHSSFTPPHVFDWTQSTVGVRHVSATVFDNVGSATADPLTVTWVDDEPPEILLAEPQDGQEVVEGSTVRVTIAAGDDVGLERAILLRNGAIFRTLLGEPPYETPLPAPAAGGDLRLLARVRDTFGHEISTPEITLVVIPDPLTTVSGRVVDESLQPVAGADLEVGTDLGSSFAGISLADGTFAVADLPTNEGELSVTAAILLGGELFRGGYPTGFETVPGGVTELGDMVLSFARPATRLVGLVTDDLGAPLAGATVRVHNRFDLLETLSDASGAFSFPRVPVAAEEGTPLLDLFVSGTADVGGSPYRGRIATPITPIEEGETDVGTLVLAPDPGLPDLLTTAVGVVFDSAGEGIGGAEVNIFTDFDFFQTTSGADGSFSIPDIPTVDGDLFATVAIVVNGFQETGEADMPLSPIPGGLTDFGDIFIGEGGPCDPCGVETEVSRNGIESS